MMPGIDGFTVCEELRKEEETSRLPVIMLSAKTDTLSVRKGLRAGATKYLTKPVSQEDLTQNVLDTLESLENQKNP
jgi:PleD family two-component response regulator